MKPGQVYRVVGLLDTCGERVLASAKNDKDAKKSQGINH
jgi:hypothetical protein